MAGISVVASLLLLPIIAVVVVRFYLRRTVHCTLPDRLDGKTVLITGASSGIGREAALQCAHRGAQLLLACRNANKAEALTAHIKRKTGNDAISYVIVDLSSLASVRHLVDECCRQRWVIDILINNAAYMGPKMRSEDGFDLCFQVNFLSHFYLTNLIIQRQTADRMTLTDDEGQGHRQRPRSLRVVNVASKSYSRGSLARLDAMTSSSRFESESETDDAGIYQTYADSKLAMMLFTTELNFRHTVDNVVCLAVHPGAVKSGLQSHWPGVTGKILRLLAALLFRDAAQGCQSVVYCALVSDKSVVDRLCGKLVVDCDGVSVLSAARAYRDAERLWSVASHLCQLTDHPVAMATTTPVAESTDQHLHHQISGYDP